MIYGTFIAPHDRPALFTADSAMALDRLSDTLISLGPASLMLLAAVLSLLPGRSPARAWRAFLVLSGLGLLAAVGHALGLAGSPAALLKVTPFAAWVSVLVQGLGVVIAAYSRHYLEGEPGQRRYRVALASVLASVHLLLIANHWLLLIAAWALVGAALQQLLCFYPERPFARLAAHKKWLSDRAADGLLLLAAALAWQEVGSGSLTDLWVHVEQEGLSLRLHLAAVSLVMAAILRTALLPVHGWLIQVMEAPTPVSALLHAGVVNLGGVVLIRFAPLLEDALMARTLLVAFGLGTAVLAGMVMMTRVSIKVRLAWSTVAQMGFMLLECGLGLYTLAALHLIGHSLYKAHAFLSASTAVVDTRARALHPAATPQPASLLLAPVLTLLVVLLVQAATGGLAWPWWWSAVFALAWAPLLWMAPPSSGSAFAATPSVRGLAMVAVLTGGAVLLHHLPLGLVDVPHDTLGLIALIGMTGLYAALVGVQRAPDALTVWRRWSYAGYYLDESYTRLALRLSRER